MANRKVSHRRLKKYGTGDMRERITLHVRAITAPDFNSANFSETYDDGVSLWAFVKTLDFVASGQALFSGANLSDIPSHLFVIRYRDGVTKENVIRWNGSAYKILKNINPEERNQYWELYAVLLGDEALAVNT